MLLLIGSTGCLDAAKGNKTLVEQQNKALSKRKVNSPFIKEHLLLPDDKTDKALLTAFRNRDEREVLAASLSAAQKDKLDALKLNLDEKDAYAACANAHKLLQAGTKGLAKLLESAEAASSETAKLNIITVFRKAIKNETLLKSARDKLCAVLRKWTRDSSQAVSSQALCLWAQIARDNELAELVRFLDTDDAGARTLIYIRLSKAKTADFLVPLAEHLNSDKVAVRTYAVNLLRQSTGKYFAYDPIGEPIARQLAVCRWTAFLLKNFGNNR